MSGLAKQGKTMVLVDSQVTKVKLAAPTKPEAPADCKAFKNVIYCGSNLRNLEVSINGGSWVNYVDGVSYGVGDTSSTKVSIRVKALNGNLPSDPVNFELTPAAVTPAAIAAKANQVTRTIELPTTIDPATVEVSTDKNTWSAYLATTKYSGNTTVYVRIKKSNIPAGEISSVEFKIAQPTILVANDSIELESGTSGGLGAPRFSDQSSLVLTFTLTNVDARLGKVTIQDNGVINFGDKIAPGTYSVTRVISFAGGDPITQAIKVVVREKANPEEFTPTIAAPTVSTTETSATITNRISSPQSMQDVRYFLFTANGTPVGNPNGQNAATFNGLTPDTEYFAKTSARVFNPPGGLLLVISPSTAVFKTVATVIVAPNKPPEFNGSFSDQSFTKNTFTSLTLTTATDPEGKNVTYSATGLPAGMTFDSNNRVISGTPTVNGVYTITYTAVDPLGAPVSANFKITVADAPIIIVPNIPPVFTGGVSNHPSFVQNVAITPYVLTAATDLQAITYSVSGLPAGLSFNPATRTVSGTPTGTGASTVTYTATDSLGATATLSYTDTVSAPIDTSPDAFDITNVTNQSISTVITTGAITVSGITAATPVNASTTLGTIVKNNTDTGLTSTTVVLGDTVAVKLTTSATYGATQNGTVTIGGESDGFSVITKANTPPVISSDGDFSATHNVQSAERTLTVSNANGGNITVTADSDDPTCSIIFTTTTTVNGSGVVKYRVFGTASGLPTITFTVTNDGSLGSQTAVNVTMN